MARKHTREMERKVAEGRPRYAEDVRAGMARLGGRSISQLEPDHQRGPGSPLGRGMISKKEERRKGR
jgi:hypothetical protein